MNMQMRDKYFDKGLRKCLLKEDYYVGVMIVIAMLKNGPLHLTGGPVP